jgi:hypothetical protein
MGAGWRDCHSWMAERLGDGRFVRHRIQTAEGMNRSLARYVDYLAFAPSPTLFRHFIEDAQRQAGSVYCRQVYD